MRYIFHMNSQRETEEKVFSYMEEHGMIFPGHRIVAGVSGGADSVCLLFVLLEYAKRVSIELAVVHVNHGLRQEAGEDAEFVRKLCQREDVPFYLKEVDVKELAAGEKRSLEEAARLLRYQAFREAAEDFRADRIAVAHNGNDRAETMLFHLFRGSGIKGLCAIMPRREDIIRPLLCLERSEIEDYLAARSLSYCTDSTNREDVYTRNRIRHHILPFAEQQVSAGAVAHMCRTADMLSEVEDYLKFQTEEAMESCVVYGKADHDGFEVDVNRFADLHIALKKRVLLDILRKLAREGRDISAIHVADVLALFEKEGNLQVDLPFDIQAVRRYDKVFLKRRQDQGEEKIRRLPLEVELPSEETKESLLFDLGSFGQAEISVFFVKKDQKFPSNEYTKWFDCDKIKKSPVFRFRQEGDYLSLADGKCGTIHKSLKDYMITEKILREKRGSIPLLAEGKHVLWLTGYRISEYYKVNENTKRVLQVKLIGNGSNRETEEKNGGAY